MFDFLCHHLVFTGSRAVSTRARPGGPAWSRRAHIRVSSPCRIALPGSCARVRAAPVTAEATARRRTRSFVVRRLLERRG
ncbi:hypothetical protein AMK20_17955 [Streptomyces sp. TSRI0261]|nr:hypothetical protein AMK20_17955 [Streptomyces sp. TSRI0261]